MSSITFDANNVDLDTADPTQVICYLANSGNDYDGRLGARISALFVILIVSTAVTFFPVVAKRVRWLKIPLYVYLFARYFGAGVIVATAFIHLLDPAYGEIGPNTCVGMTGHWADYSWCPAIVLTSVIFIFLLDFVAERYVEVKYGAQSAPDIQEAVTGELDDRGGEPKVDAEAAAVAFREKFSAVGFNDNEEDSAARERSFKQQISAFLILEFGVIFRK
ncbi:high-affinity Zn(2+) transporter zrt1 [Schaereria dolodes]|nr:high-affinity Zn(2+) transporter zrt1 [Schaereria dolodes]